MSKNNYISAFCSIKNGLVQINNEVDFKAQEGQNASDFLKSIYKHYNINYPKFYKMDSLCKLAFLTSELLFRCRNINAVYSSEDIAIIIANSTSSLEIDTDHQNSINDKQNYFPSPSNFVYTLPNILIGEIAIRNQIKGENTFFIFDKFDTQFMNSYTNSLLNNNKAKVCVTGWVDFFENNYEAELYLIEETPQGLNIEHTIETINKLINN